METRERVTQAVAPSAVAILDRPGNHAEQEELAESRHKLAESERRVAAKVIRKVYGHVVLSEHKAVSETVLALLDAIEKVGAKESIPGNLGELLTGMRYVPLATCRRAVEAAMVESKKGTDALAEIEKGRGEVEAVIDHLDEKARAIIGALLLLAELDDITNGPDWPQRLLFDTLGDPEQTEAALAAAGDDADVSVMRRFFNLGWQVLVVAEPDHYGDTAGADESEAAE